MNVEELLKEQILLKHKSIRAFALKCGIPYTTIMSVLKRGIGRASTDVIFSICDCLEIDANHLVKNQVVELSSLVSKENEFMYKYNQLNIKGKARMESYIDDLLASSKYIKE